MSIVDQINRLTSNRDDSFLACSEKHATLPADRNTDNLPAAIRSIDTGYDTKIIQKNLTLSSSSGNVLLISLQEFKDAGIIGETETSLGKWGTWDINLGMITATELSKNTIAGSMYLYNGTTTTRICNHTSNNDKPTIITNTGTGSSDGFIYFNNGNLYITTSTNYKLSNNYHLTFVVTDRTSDTSTYGDKLVSSCIFYDGVNRYNARFVDEIATYIDNPEDNTWFSFEDEESHSGRFYLIVGSNEYYDVEITDNMLIEIYEHVISDENIDYDNLDSSTEFYDSTEFFDSAE